MPTMEPHPFVIHVITTAALILQLDLFSPLTDAWVYKEMAKNDISARVSDAGRLFFLALPSNLNDGSELLAEVAFMTYWNRATVTMLEPKVVVTTAPFYRSSTFVITYGNPAVKNINKDQRITESNVGCAIRITSSEDITVMVNYFAEVTDLFILPPVKAYGLKYILFSPGTVSLVVTIAAHEMTHVHYKFDEQSMSFLVKCSWNATCGTNKATDIYLNASTFSFVTTSFDETEGMDQSVSGTTIDADKPVLVFLGNRASVKGKLRLTFTPQVPIQLWGRTFIIINDYVKLNKAVFSIGLASVDQATECVITDNAGFRKTHSTLAAYKHLWRMYLELPGTDFYVMECSYAVSVIFYSTHENVNRHSLFQFPGVPVNRWPNFVQFTKPKSLPSTLIFFLSIVVEEAKREELIYNGDKLANFEWKSIYQVRGLPLYCFAQIEATDSYFYLKTLQPNNYFVAYVTGVNKDMTVGVGTQLGSFYDVTDDRPGFPCTVDHLRREHGDNIDNDCDKLFDEEAPDGIDDDDDGLIDEDTYLPRVNGEWGPWQSWYCNASCESQGSMMRQRSCENPPPWNYGSHCDGNRTESGKMCDMTRGEGCSQDERIECPNGKYLRDCEGICPKLCEGKACEKMTGRCYACQDGYTQTDFCDVEGYFLHKTGDPSLLGAIWYKFLIPLLLLLLVVVLIVGDTLMRRIEERTRQDEEAFDGEEEDQNENDYEDEDED